MTQDFTWTMKDKNHDYRRYFLNLIFAENTSKLINDLREWNAIAKILSVNVKIQLFCTVLSL